MSEACFLYFFSEEEKTMRTDPSLTVVSREPGLPPGLRRFSNVTKKLLTAFALMLVSSGTSVYAADGPYVGIGGSLSILNESEVTAPGRDGYPALNVDAATKNGFAVRGMAGYAFPSGFRLEAEIDYRRHDTNQLDAKSPGGLVEVAAPGVAAAINAQAGRPIYPDPANTSYGDLHDAHKAAAAAVAGGKKDVDGAFSMLAFMANVDYDFKNESRWVPYVGGGLGLAIISLDTELAINGRSLVDDSDTVLAFQVGAGLGYEFPLEEGRSITVSLDWRYFGTQTPTFKGDVTGNEFDATIGGHDIGIGLIYGF